MAQQENILTSLEQYRSEVLRLPRLTASEERELEQRARLGDEQARQQLIASSLQYVASVAWRYVCYVRQDDYPDLVQEKLRMVYNSFFAAPLHQALRIPSDFHTTPLGSLLNDARAQVTSLKSAVNIADVARTAGVTRQTIYDWIDQGKLTPIYVNGKPMLPLSQLEQLKHDRS